MLRDDLKWYKEVVAYYEKLVAHTYQIIDHQGRTIKELEKEAKVLRDIIHGGRDNAV